MKSEAYKKVLKNYNDKLPTNEVFPRFYEENRDSSIASRFFRDYLVFCSEKFFLLSKNIEKKLNQFEKPIRGLLTLPRVYIFYSIPLLRGGANIIHRGGIDP